MNFIIHEPVTVITNFIIAAFCFFWYTQLRRKESIWGYFYLFMGLATFMGALGHGLYVDRDNAVSMISRVLAMIGCTLAFQAAIKLAVLPYRRYKISLWTIWPAAFLAVSVLVMFNNFEITKWYSTATMGIGVGVISAIRWFKYKEKFGLFALGGISIIASAAIIHSLKISLHEHFNENDLGHIPMLIGMWVIYLAVKQQIKLIEKSAVEKVAEKA